jgi:hypothetical protein
VEERAEHVAGAARELAPVGAELERHDDPGHHAHAERHGEDPGPEPGQTTVHGTPALQPDRLEHDDPRREPDGERREQDVERDAERELQSRQQHGIEVHAISLRACRNARAYRTQIQSSSKARSPQQAETFVLPSD